MRRGTRRIQLLAWLLSFLFVLGAGGQTGFALRLPQKTETPAAEPQEKVPNLKLYAKCEPAQAALRPQTLQMQKGAFAEAQKLYDGDAETVFGSEKPETVTLDLGRMQMLGAVRFLPAHDGQGAAANRCLGTVFSVSKDNRSFQRAVTAEPMNHEDYQADWKELSFGGVGEARYVRVEIPAGARIAEIEWLTYPEWSYTSAARGETSWNLRLYGYDAQKELEARLVAGVYNAAGVLKTVSVSDHTFLPGEESVIDLQLAVPKHEIGDSYRIMVWEKDGASALLRPLEYRYTQASETFSMPNLFSDDMMFQAEKPLTVWGKAPTGSQVTVTLTSRQGGEAVATTTVKSGSDWEVELGNFSPGGDYTLTVACGGAVKRFSHITFGDVWLCMGQSNMDYHLLGGEDTQKYLESEQGKKETNNPDIRLLNLWTKGTGGSGAKVENLPIGYRAPAWSAMNKEAASYCSAIGYYFAQQIQTEYHIPVGIINAAVGDTEINRWIPCGMTCGSFTSTDGGLYYNRILPFAKLQIRGILMYQGEADEYRTHLSTEQYRDALSGLVDHYRGIWGKDLPFYWTQLTRYQKDESLIREGQRLALAKISNPKNAGIVSLMDIYGEYKGSGAGSCREDIHPHQKKVVADRFLRYAKRDVYGEPDITVAGPIYQSMRRVGDGLELTFTSDGGLRVMPAEQYADAKGMQWIRDNKADKNALQSFELAGADGVFHPAKAEIRGDTVLLQSDAVKRPTAVRYAWGAYPEMPNLTDGSLLPALSFCAELP